MKYTVWGTQSIIMSQFRMVTDGNSIYRGDHFEMYRDSESLCCITETNMILQVNYTSKKHKLTHRKYPAITKEKTLDPKKYFISFRTQL